MVIGLHSKFLQCNLSLCYYGQDQANDVARSDELSRLRRHEFVVGVYVEGSTVRQALVENNL